MKLQIGDIVRYLNEVGGGKVQNIINSNTVEILDENGFVLRVKESELVFVGHSQKQNESAEQQNEMILAEDSTESVEIEGNDNPNLFIAFVRNAKDSGKFELFLINDCNYNLLYVMSYRTDDLLKKISSNLLEANTKVMVAEFSYEDISHMEKLYFQGVFFKNDKFLLQKDVDVEIPINPVKFYKPGVFIVNDFFDEDAYVLNFYDAEKNAKSEIKEEQQIDAKKLERVLHENQSKGQEKSIEKDGKDLKKEGIREIDLHIEKLTNKPENITASEKLEIQIRTFESELFKALNENLDEIVFIHGKGNGILKAKICGILDRDYSECSYKDASFNGYNGGATLITLHKSHK